MFSMVQFLIGITCVDFFFQTQLFSSSSGEENLEPLSALLESAPRQDSSIPLKHPSQQSNELICQICLVENIDCIFYSCGHMYCCNSCALKLNESNNCCPVCRKVITVGNRQGLPVKKSFVYTLLFIRIYFGRILRLKFPKF